MVNKINCFPKKKENIYIPARKDVLPILEKLSDKIVDRVVPLDELIDIIGLFISSNFRINVMHGTSNNAVPGSMMINAEYDQEQDEKNKISITMILITFPNDNNFLWDEEQFDHVMKQIADTVIHELVHMKQCRARDFEEYHYEQDEFDDDKQAAQHYLGNYDEIDAYSYNIACELLDCGNLHQARKTLSCPSKITLESSVNLWAYLNTFDKNVNHPKIRKLIKKIYKRLTNYH